MADHFLNPYLVIIRKVLGKPWTLRILIELRTTESLRFNDLLDTLDGISRSTLSLALKDLHNLKLVSRKSYNQTPPYKVEYHITDFGVELLISLYPLLKWAVKYGSLIENDTGSIDQT